MHGAMVDVVILLAKSHRHMSEDRKDVQGLCEKDTTNSEFLFAENLVESTSEAKETSKMSKK